jgi:hypothetical protein
MSSLFLALSRENPWPVIAVALLNLIVALSLVGVSLLLGVTISVLAWVHALADREPVPHAAKRRRLMNCKPSTTSGRTAGEQSWIALKGLQRGDRAL